MLQMLQQRGGSDAIMRLVMKDVIPLSYIKTDGWRLLNHALTLSGHHKDGAHHIWECIDARIGRTLATQQKRHVGTQANMSPKGVVCFLCFVFCWGGGRCLVELG